MPRRANPIKPIGPKAIVERLQGDFRFWAALPGAHVALVLGPPGAQMASETVLAAIPRPTFPKGVCRQCGCTETDPCLNAFDEGCSWTDRTQTCCSSTQCVNAAARERKAAPKGKRR